jgi:2-polyprenyl-6-hydroxyphenyl methylase/3-demethylubiquinone-9 3-methyltransferase
MEDPALTEIVAAEDGEKNTPGELATDREWLRRLIAEGSYHYVYTNYDSEHPDHWHRYLWPAVLNDLRQYLNGSQILDAGCGNGAFCRELIKLPRVEISGVDLSQTGIEIARKTCPEATFKIASITDDIESIFGHTFDAIVCLEVIAYMYDPRGFLEALRDGLRPGGTLIISTAFHGYWKNLALALVGKWDKHLGTTVDGGPIKFWSRSALSRLLEETGFEIKHFVGCGRVPLLWKSMVITAIRR